MTRGRKPASHTTERDLLVARASRAVWRAIKGGKLQHFSLFACVDCGLPATCYDHRDYTKPLDVEPVCAGCNNRRGPGWPFPAESDGSAHKHTLPGSSGNNWSGLDGGEGFAPLQCRIPPEIEAAADAAINAYALSSWLTTLDTIEAALRLRFSKGGGRGKGWSSPTGIARAEWFKRRDPWYA